MHKSRKLLTHAPRCATRRTSTRRRTARRFETYEGRENRSRLVFSRRSVYLDLKAFEPYKVRLDAAIQHCWISSRNANNTRSFGGRRLQGHVALSLSSRRYRRAIVENVRAETSVSAVALHLLRQPSSRLLWQPSLRLLRQYVGNNRFRVAW